MGKVRIVVNGVGAFPGKTRGDVIENPTEAQLAYARKNWNCFSILPVKADEKPVAEKK